MNFYKIAINAIAFLMTPEDYYQSRNAYDM